MWKKKKLCLKYWKTTKEIMLWPWTFWAQLFDSKFNKFFIELISILRRVQFYQYNQDVWLSTLSTIQFVFAWIFDARNENIKWIKVSYWEIFLKAVRQTNGKFQCEWIYRILFFLNYKQTSNQLFWNFDVLWIRISRKCCWYRSWQLRLDCVCMDIYSHSILTVDCFLFLWLRVYFVALYQIKWKIHNSISTHNTMDKSNQIDFKNQ